MVSTVGTAAQTTDETLAKVNIPRAVVANGQPLAAGTYTLRLSAEVVAPVAGETPTGSRWIEFVQGSQVMGREAPTVVAAGPDAQTILKGPGPPPGTARVELLKGEDYLRIWVNRNGTQYLIHLPVK
jgi:hypothetical protein